jgi:Ca2+-binding RTX toxin-like protein
MFSLKDEEMRLTGGAIVGVYFGVTPNSKPITKTTGTSDSGGGSSGSTDAEDGGGAEATYQKFEDGSVRTTIYYPNGIITTIYMTSSGMSETVTTYPDESTIKQWVDQEGNITYRYYNSEDQSVTYSNYPIKEQEGDTYLKIYNPDVWNEKYIEGNYIGPQDSFVDDISQAYEDLKHAIFGTGLYTNSYNDRQEENFEARLKIWEKLSQSSSPLQVLDGTGGSDDIVGRDVIAGGAGADNLIGSSGSDLLAGGTGDDVLHGGGSGDMLSGGEGYDFANYFAATSGVAASLDNPDFNGGDALGDLYSSIEGLAGSTFSDTLTGSKGDNRLYGHQGDDLLSGLAGLDTLLGGDGADTLAGGDGADSLDGGSGVDWVSYATATRGVRVDLAAGRGSAKDAGGAFLDADGDTYVGIENVEGGNGADILTGDGGANWLKGLGSDDILQGGAGADTLDGGSGYNFASYYNAGAGVSASLKNPAQNTGEAVGDVYLAIQGLQGSNYGDTLIGRDGGTSLSGLGGNDELVGGTGADNLDGGDGNDILEGGAGSDRLEGGAGYDWVSYAASTVGVQVNLATGQGGAAWGGTSGDAVGDTYGGIEHAKGGSGHDVLIGSVRDNWLLGLAGDDILQGNGGGDMLDGGAGFDWASYRTVGAVQVDLGTGATGGSAAGDVLVSIEGLEGSDYADTLTGNGLANALYGYGGADTLKGDDGADELNGGSGDDWLYGGTGADQLTGGAGRDTFAFTTALGASNVDRIADFSTADDAICLAGGVFGGVSLNSLLFGGAFKAGAYATSASNRIVYNGATGELFYDADGSGAGAQVKFAELSKGLALTAANFVVI